MSAAPGPHGSSSSGVSRAFPAVIATLMAVHACMAVTRVTASLWVLDRGYAEWIVGLLQSLFAVAPVGLSLWAGRLADRHGFHRPVGIGAVMALVLAMHFFRERRANQLEPRSAGAPAGVDGGSDQQKVDA